MLSVPGLIGMVMRLRLRGARAQAALAEGGPDSDPSRRRPKDGPPDLDELWQDFNRRINGLLGGRGGRGGGRGGSPGGSPSGGGSSGAGGPGFKGTSIGAAALIVGGVLLLVWLASGFFIVQEGYSSVILQFGRYKEMRGSGIQWRFPAPIQSH